MGEGRKWKRFVREPDIEACSKPSRKRYPLSPKQPALTSFRIAAYARPISKNPPSKCQSPILRSRPWRASLKPSSSPQSVTMCGTVNLFPVQTMETKFNVKMSLSHFLGRLTDWQTLIQLCNRLRTHASWLNVLYTSHIVKMSIPTYPRVYLSALFVHLLTYWLSSWRERVWATGYFLSPQV